MPSGLNTHTLGLPRIGLRRELKKATEAYWHGNISLENLNGTGQEIRRSLWCMQTDAGISMPCSNDFSFYDRMLDMSCLVNAIPERFRAKGLNDIDLAFAMARGLSGTQGNAQACEMTKWFDTNYHYIVPELDEKTPLQLVGGKPLAEFREALALGIRTKPLLIGPVTYLYLSKNSAQASSDFHRLNLLDRLLELYGEILRQLAKAGADWVTLEEPILSLELDERWTSALEQAYGSLQQKQHGLRIMVANYFGPLGRNLPLATSLPVEALHIDLLQGKSEALAICDHFASSDKILSLGVVDGRNIWRNDFAKTTQLLGQALGSIPNSRLWLAPTCSLQHVPLSLASETNLDAELTSWLSFANEKLSELGFLAQWACGDYSPSAWEENCQANQARAHSPRLHRTSVRNRLDRLHEQDFMRQSAYPSRRRVQQEYLNLPLFPTTTIGSFPQTAEIRQIRAAYKAGKLAHEAYQSFLRDEIASCIAEQEMLGLDVLVHGEAERNDMVEFFGEQLDGFAFTQNGWVQSYGSRCVKPPILYGDVERRAPMTVAWATYAQSLSSKPVKGMLTGPITILQWSFVRDDQPRQQSAWQVALALRDEVHDLENSGIRVIQIDEPALREGLPLKNSEWSAYLHWAVAAFKLCSAGVCDQTQIHTHMCYAEFNDILAAIVAMDADVITLETSRSSMESLSGFIRQPYPLGIGPGVYDIHSPRVPSSEEMLAHLTTMTRIFPVENLWVNPDCGLKTRGWSETRAALGNMVDATRKLRAFFNPHTPT